MSIEMEEWRAIQFKQEYTNYVQWHCGACQHFMRFDLGAGQFIQCPQCKILHRILWEFDGTAIEIAFRVL